MVLLEILILTDESTLFDNDLRPFLHTHYRYFTGSTSAFQHRFSGLLFFDRLFSERKPGTFPRSDNPIFALLPLGFHYRPVSWNAPVTHYGISYMQFLLYHADCELTPGHISMSQKYRPVHSRIRQITFIILTIGIL